MIYRGYDLPWSLDVCDSLATDWDQSSCTGGVFMENISSSYGIKSQWVRDDDGVYPCREMKERHKLYCYLMVTSRINELNGFDWAATAATCRTVEEDWIETCFESFGRDASGQTLEVGKKIAPLCDLAGDYTSSCVYGAARDLSSYDPSGKKAAEFCRIVRAELKERCWNGVGTIVASIYATPAEQRRACAKAPAAYRGACRFGAGLYVASARSRAPAPNSSASIERASPRCETATRASGSGASVKTTIRAPEDLSLRSSAFAPESGRR